MALYDEPTETVRLMNQQISRMYHTDAGFRQQVDLAVQLTEASHADDLAGKPSVRRAMTYAAAWATAMTMPAISEIIEKAMQQAREQREALLLLLPPAVIDPILWES